MLCCSFLFAAQIFIPAYDDDYKNKYKWLPEGFVLLDYGIDENDVPFAVITANYLLHEFTSYRRKSIDFLLSKGLSREEASSFHRVDFYYEFTPDCEKYALAHARFYEKHYLKGRSRLIYSIDKIKRVLRNTSDDSVMKEVAKTMFREKVFDKYELSKKIDKNKRLTIKSKE